MARPAVWNEADHPRAEDGKFAHSSGRSSGSSRGDRTAERDTDRRGMPDDINADDIPVRDNQELALDSHTDGTLTIASGDRTVHLDERTADDMKVYLDRMAGEDAEVGDEDWVTSRKSTPDGVYSTLKAIIRKEENDRFSLRLAPNDDPSSEELEAAPPLNLNSRDLANLDKALDRMRSGSRLDTGYGDVDLYINGDNQFTIRHLGDDGRPVSIGLDPASYERLTRAIDVVIDGFDADDPGGPDSGVTEVDIDTNVGKVRVELSGIWQGNSPGDMLTIGPADGDAWGIVIEGPRQDTFMRGLDKLGEVGDSLGIITI